MNSWRFIVPAEIFILPVCLQMALSRSSVQARPMTLTLLALLIKQRCVQTNRICGVNANLSEIAGQLDQNLPIYYADSNDGINYIESATCNASKFVSQVPQYITRAKCQTEFTLKNIFIKICDDKDTDILGFAIPPVFNKYKDSLYLALFVRVADGFAYTAFDHYAHNMKNYEEHFLYEVQTLMYGDSSPLRNYVPASDSFSSQHKEYIKNLKEEE